MEKNEGILNEVMTEIVSVAGDPMLTMDSLANHMNRIWTIANNSGDHQAMQLVNHAWDEVNMIQQQAGTAINVAVAAKEMAKHLQTQRDALAEKVQSVTLERDDLIEAAQNSDDQEVDWAYEQISDDIQGTFDLVSELYEIDLDYRVFSSLFEKLVGKEKLTDDQAGLIFDLISIEIDIHAEREREIKAGLKGA